MLSRLFSFINSFLSERRVQSSRSQIARNMCPKFELLEDRRLLSASPGVAKMNGDLALIGNGFTAVAAAVASQTDAGDIAPDYSLWQWQGDSIGITAVPASDPESLASDLALLGMQSASIAGGTVSGFLPVAAISGLAALDSLRFAQPALNPVTNVGLTTSGGDVAQRSQTIRTFVPLLTTHLGCSVSV